MDKFNETRRAGTTNSKDLIHEFRLAYCGDAWGSCMNWLFAISAELYWERQCEVPDEWDYTPSPFGNDNDPDAYEVNVCREAGTDALLRFGKILERYERNLRRRGHNY